MISKNKGISLVVMVITVVVMIILFGVIVFNVDNVGQESTAMKFLSDISMIETKVAFEQYNAGANDEYDFKGTELTALNSMTVGNITYPIGTDKCYLLNSNDLINLGVKEIEGNYIINYTTGTVISVDGINIDGVVYHTFEEVADAIDFQY